MYAFCQQLSISLLIEKEILNLSRSNVMNNRQDIIGLWVLYLVNRLVKTKYTNFVYSTTPRIEKQNIFSSCYNLNMNTKDRKQSLSFIPDDFICPFDLKYRSFKEETTRRTSFVMIELLEAETQLKYFNFF